MEEKNKKISGNVCSRVKIWWRGVDLYLKSQWNAISLFLLADQNWWKVKMMKFTMETIIWQWKYSIWHGFNRSFKLAVQIGRGVFHEMETHQNLFLAIFDWTRNKTLIILNFLLIPDYTNSWIVIIAKIFRQIKRLTYNAILHFIQVQSRALLSKNCKLILVSII